MSFGGQEGETRAGSVFAGAPCYACNRFVGGSFYHAACGTVSGLLTGQDLLAQLKGENLGEKLLLPCNLLRSGEEVFLDDMTLAELKEALQVPIDIVKSSGQDFLDALLF